MARNGSSYPSRPHSAQKPQHQGHSQCSSSYGHNAGAVESSNRPTVAHETTHSHQSHCTTYQYPQSIEIPPHSLHFTTQDHSSVAQNAAYSESSRPWTYINPNAYDLISHPALDPNLNYTAPISYTYYNAAPSTHQPVTQGEKKQVTMSNLAAFDVASPPTSNMRRYEQQGQRAGPWDGAGYIKSPQGGR